MNGKACAAHSQVEGKWLCASCGNAFCDKCVLLDFVGDRRVERCPICGGRCKDSTAVAVAAKAAEPVRFYSELPKALAYPLVGRGKFVILGGAIFFFVIGIVQKLAMMAPISYMGTMAFAATFALSCIIFAYMFDVIGHSAGGDEEPPSWPGVTNIGSDLILPFFKFIGALLFSLTPAIVLRLLIGLEYVEATPFMLSLMYLWFGVGLFYFPMCLLATAIFDGIAGYNPARILRAIFKVAPAYMICVVFMAVVLVGSVFVGKYIAVPLPVIGPLIGGAFMIYIMMVEMRIIGLLYAAYKDRLAWLPE